MKTYVITLSKVFPKTHYRAGEETDFGPSLLRTLAGLGGEKIHTIRTNYPLWKQRAVEINAGRAILSVRQWSGAPYRSKQVEIAKLTKIGVECLVKMDIQTAIVRNFEQHPFKEVDISKTVLAENDYLSLPDFNKWFKEKPTCESPFAIIHFTDFRYRNL